MMAMIYSVVRDPEEVKRSDNEHAAILGAIQGLRFANQTNDQIAEVLVRQFHMIPQYARNYIEEFDLEVAENRLPWQQP